PVLAILGDNDKHVDWRKTKRLYEQTMGKGDDSQLNIKVFKGADHALKMSKTGDYFEVSKPGYWDLPYAKGVFKSMVDFLCTNKFCVEN
ncbi:MAG: dienelactone hydrolase family protein, partial [Kangiellaceae bacterium]|nr:dienelactone hydrolase family protein [Kangiellaceae bacterium]